MHNLVTIVWDIMLKARMRPLQHQFLKCHAKMFFFVMRTSHHFDGDLMMLCACCPLEKIAQCDKAHSAELSSG